MRTERRKPRRIKTGALGRASLGAALAALLATPAGAATRPPAKSAAAPASRPAPRLMLLTPPRGASGSTVTLVGKNLGAAKGSVLFGGTAAIVRWSDTSVTVVLKAPRSARCPLRVRRADGRASNALMFDLR